MTDPAHVAARPATGTTATGPGSLVRLLRCHARPLLIYHVFFSVLAATLVAPLAAWVLDVLLRYSGSATVLVGLGDFLDFARSPSGLLWTLGTGTSALLVLMLQHAGMLRIAAAQDGDHYRTALAALWVVARRAGDLLVLAAIRVAAHVLVTAPFAIALALAYDFWLGAYAFGYLRITRPPVLWLFVACAAPLVLTAAAVNVIVYLRWVLSLPALMLEGRRAWPALRRSVELTRGRRRSIAAAVASVFLVALGLPVAVALLFETLADNVLMRMPENLIVLAPVVLGFTAAYVLSAFAAVFAGVASISLVLYMLYRHAAGWRINPPMPPVARGVGPLAWGVEAVLVAFALGQAAYILHSFDFRDEVTVTAHRGSSLLAPENSLGAIELAVAEGADYVEVDVRQAADGTLVLLHDSHLRRVAGIDRAIRDVAYADLRERVIRHGDTRVALSRRVPTLAEAIEAVRGRANLYVEIKPDPRMPDLVPAVVALLQERGAVNGTIVGCARADVLRQVARLEPRLRTALFGHVVVGALDRSLFDALALRASRVTGREIDAARRYGYELHVWTVNRREDMSYFLDLGVDNIITDRPGALVGLLRERRQKSRAELLLIQLGNWLRR